MLLIDANAILRFMLNDNIETESKEVILFGLKTFAEIKMDFVDCVLYAFKAVNNFDVFTFDKKLARMMSKISHEDYTKEHQLVRDGNSIDEIAERIKKRK